MQIMSYIIKVLNIWKHGIRWHMYHSKRRIVIQRIEQINNKTDCLVLLFLYPIVVEACRHTRELPSLFTKGFLNVISRDSVFEYCRSQLQRCHFSYPAQIHSELSISEPL